MKALLGLVCFSVVACGGGGQKSKPVATQSVTTDSPAPGAGGAHGHDHAAAAAVLRLDQIAAGAALMPELGTHARAITTTSKEAQAYFDQGVRLIYGFNHDEAARSFAKAALLDPKCASCYWGLALVLGPNYNVPMLPDRFPAAWDALQKAQQNAASAKPVEQALIGWLSALPSWAGERRRRKWAFARDSRLITVPIGASIVSAICLYDLSSK